MRVGGVGLEAQTSAVVCNYACRPALAETGSLAPDNCTGLRSPGRDDPGSAPVFVDQG
jgi:hypothetical protein